MTLSPATLAELLARCTPGIGKFRVRVSAGPRPGGEPIPQDAIDALLELSEVGYIPLAAEVVRLTAECERLSGDLTEANIARHYLVLEQKDRAEAAEAKLAEIHTLALLFIGGEADTSPDGALGFAQRMATLTTSRADAGKGETG